MPTLVNEDLVHQYMHKQLVVFNNGIAKVLKGDCIFLCADILKPVDRILKEALGQ